MMSNATLRYFKEASLIRCWKSLEREDVSDGKGGWNIPPMEGISPASPLPAGLFEIAADNLGLFSVIAERAGVTDRIGGSSA